MTVLKNKILSYSPEQYFTTEAAYTGSAVNAGTATNTGGFTVSGGNPGFNATGGPGGNGCWQFSINNTSEQALRAFGSTTSGQIYSQTMDNDYSAGGWFRFPSQINSTEAAIEFFRFGGSNSGSTLTMTGGLGGNVGRVALTNPTANTTIRYDDGLWHYYAERVSFDGTTHTKQRYFDGVLFSTTTTTATPSLWYVTMGDSSITNTVTSPAFVEIAHVYVAPFASINATAISEIWTAGQAAPVNVNNLEAPATATALQVLPTISRGTNNLEAPATASALIVAPTIVIVQNDNTEVTTSILVSALFPSNISVVGQRNVNNIEAPATASTELINNVIVSTGVDDSFSATEFIASAQLVTPRVSEVPFIASATMPNAVAAVEESYFALVKELNPYFYINSGTGVSTTINYGYQTGTITRGSQLLTSQDGGYPLNTIGNAFSWKGATTNNADNRIFFQTANAANSFDNLIGTGNFAYEVWTKPLAFPDNQLTSNDEPQQSIFRNDNLEVYLDDYYRYQESFPPYPFVNVPRSINLRIKNGTSSFNLQSSGLDGSSLSLNNWNHIVINVYQSGINPNERLVQLWINGQVIFNSNISFTPWTTTETLSTVLGSKSAGLKYVFDTFADELAIYAQPLTNSQIIEHHQFISTMSPNHFEFAEEFTATAESGDHNFIVISNAIISETPATATALLANPSVLAVKNVSTTAPALTASADNTDVTVFYGWTIYADAAIAYAERPGTYFLNDLYYQYVQTNIAPYRYVTFDAADGALDYGTDNDYSVTPTTIGGTIVNPDLGINGKSVKTTGSSYITDGVILKESEWNDSWGTGANDWHSAFWFQRALDDNSTTGLRVLWNLNGYKDNQHAVLYQYQGRLHMQFNNGSGTFIETDSTALDLFDYQRHFIVIDHNHGGGNSNTIKLYVDSVLRFTVNIGSITPTTTNAATADSGSNLEENNHPRLSIGCLITPFGSTALPVQPTTTKLIIDEVYWDKNVITQTQVTNLYNAMPDKNNKTVIAEPFLASDELVMPAFSTSSILAAVPLTGSGSVLQPQITANREVVRAANIMMATALAGNAVVFEDKIITSDVFVATATFNSAGVVITIPGGPMLASAKLANEILWNLLPLTDITPYIRYLRLSSLSSQIYPMREVV